MLLKHYLDQGVSKAELSRQFGVNRRTIHYWIETGQLDREVSPGAGGYAPRPPVEHKLDPYKAIIRRASRRSPSCRRSVCSTRSARRATRAATPG